MAVMTTRRTALLLLTVFVALVAAPATAAPSASRWQLPPTPGCISDAEWRTLDLNPAVTRNEMEARFDVADVRVNVTPPGEAHRFFVYPACGHPFDRVQVEITLERDNRPGFDRSKVTNGQRVIVGGLWWFLPAGQCDADQIRACYLHGPNGTATARKAAR